MAMSIAGPGHPRFVDLTGQQFGRLVVVRYAGRGKRFHRWECLCECGLSSVVRSINLRSGQTNSCGCLRKERAAQVSTKHGGCRDKTPEWRAWCNLIRRCEDTKAPYYADYGGRGIKVCDRWRSGEKGRHGYECFLIDVGLKPEPSFTMDRIDVNGDYEPTNCRWLSRAEQQMNRRSTVKVVIDGAHVSFFEAIQQSSPTLLALRADKERGLTIQEIFEALKEK